MIKEKAAAGSYFTIRTVSVFDRTIQDWIIKEFILVLITIGFSEH